MSLQSDPTEFAGKRVLVSGGTKGLGRAAVERFVAGGARVITAARGAAEPTSKGRAFAVWCRPSACFGRRSNFKTSRRSR